MVESAHRENPVPQELAEAGSILSAAVLLFTGALGSVRLVGTNCHSVHGELLRPYFTARNPLCKQLRGWWLNSSQTIVFFDYEHEWLKLSFSFCNADQKWLLFHIYLEKESGTPLGLRSEMACAPAFKAGTPAI